MESKAVCEVWNIFIGLLATNVIANFQKKKAIVNVMQEKIQQQQLQQQAASGK